jgi:tetraacyldisaccharide 4'-kinase
MAGRIRRGLANGNSADIPVICLGNLTAGGTGKTPLCLALAKRLSSEGFEVHLLTRGYGGSLKGPALVDTAVHTAKDVGDEALLLAGIAPTWVGADRYSAAQAAQAAGATLLLMDDGFQNPTLLKDFSILAIENDFGFGNGQVIPAGPLREFVGGGLARADAVILTGAQKLPSQKLASTLAESGLDVFKSHVEAGHITPALPVESSAPSASVVAFSGIGRPQKFFDTLAEQGHPIVEAVPFPDHHVFEPKDLSFLKLLAEEREAQLVTTSKDHVRLPSEFKSQVHILPIEAIIEDEDRLISLIKEKLAPASY